MSRVAKKTNQTAYYSDLDLWGVRKYLRLVVNDRNAHVVRPETWKSSPSSK